MSCSPSGPLWTTSIELVATIRVVQEPCRWFPVRQRHVRASSARSTVTHRPADHSAHVQIEHHGEINPALLGPDVGDVSGPHTVGLVDLELQVEGVHGHRPRVARVGRGAPLLHGWACIPSDRMSGAMRFSPTQCHRLISVSQMLGLRRSRGTLGGSPDCESRVRARRRPEYSTAGRCRDHGGCTPA
jgi:hypothetical protein